MRIIKRNGSEEDFNIEKIINAVKKLTVRGNTSSLQTNRLRMLPTMLNISATKSGEQCPLKKFRIWLRIS